MYLKREAQDRKTADRVLAMVSNLETLAMQLEEQNINRDTAFAMKVGADALKASQATFTVDAVQDLQDEVIELMQNAEDISDALAQPWQVTNEAELADSLAELEAELASDTMATVPASHIAVPAVSVPNVQNPQANLAFPAVPTGPISQNASVPMSMDDELAALEAN